MREQSLLIREERVLASVPERLAFARESLDTLKQSLPIDRVFLSAKALEDLPGQEILARADSVLARLNEDLERVAEDLERVLDRADRGIAAVRSEWEVRKSAVQAEYEKILRELQKSRVDGEEFIRLRRQIEELRPLRERQSLLRRLEKEQGDRRRDLLARWEDLKAEEFRFLDRAAKKVNRRLRGSVEVQVTAEGNREPLLQLLRDQVGGRLSEALERLTTARELSLSRPAEACREGSKSLKRELDLPPSQADRLANADPEVLLQIEETELPPTTAIRLKHRT